MRTMCPTMQVSRHFHNQSNIYLKVQSKQSNQYSTPSNQTDVRGVVEAVLKNNFSRHTMLLHNMQNYPPVVNDNNAGRSFIGVKL